MELWKNELNPAQREAVCHTEGPLLILAGAGSGKTRVLTYRIAQLLKNGVDPGRILAVTFTNKAAQEMKERVIQLIGPQAEQIWLMTFHAACVRILRRDGAAIGVASNFVIYDTQDQLIVVREALQELNISEKTCNPRAVLATISRAKNELVGPEEYAADAVDFWASLVKKVYPLYQKKLVDNGAVDFDDLIGLTIRLFRECPEVLAKYQERFRYILIDEYQDTNYAQYVLVRLLADKYRNLCVVGDDDQSIYGFRNADIRNILDFEKDYPEVKVVKLEQNYRSTQNILRVANEVIRNNHSRKTKTLWTENEEGEPVTLIQAADEREEAWLVTATLEELVRTEGYRYSDFAFLYRTNAQSRVFEEVLIQKGLPYQVVGGLRFYDRKEIRDLLSYLKLIYNPNDRISLRRVINTPKRGIGETTVERFFSFMDTAGLNTMEAFRRVAEIPGITGRAAQTLTGFAAFLEEMLTLKETLSVSNLTRAVLNKSGYLPSLQQEGTVEAESRLENLNEFLSITAGFEKESDDQTLGAFLETVALVADVDQYQEQESITLMTIHSAKGLEFPVVFLVGMEEGIFPHSRSLLDEAELEEERRLCYVGMTRARQRLYLSYAQMRTLYGNFQYQVPSRFIQEIPPALLQRRERTEQEPPAVAGYGRFFRPAAMTAPGAPAVPSAPNTPAAPTSSAPGADKPITYCPGDKVIHRKWGQGTIITVDGTGQGAKVKVAFPGLGIKELLVELAPLEKVE
ncbi:MAG TPA: DNA helicase PcrA [Firmicutes bacterium]|nr:DNA helicase PcrA [Bacillota bacterium]